MIPHAGNGGMDVPDECTQWMETKTTNATVMLCSQLQMAGSQGRFHVRRKNATQVGVDAYNLVYGTLVGCKLYTVLVGGKNKL